MKGRQRLKSPGNAARRTPIGGLPVALLVVLLSAVPFIPAITAGFSDFDDQGFVVEAKGWQGLAPENLAWMFRENRLGHYQPLTYLSYAVDHACFGLSAPAMHATNILLHALTAGVLTRLFALLLAARRCTLGTPDPPTTPEHLAAAAAALLWSLHPLRVESVAWITERRDVLSGLLLALASLHYLRSAGVGAAPLASRPRYAACVALLALSLLAKAWGITFVGIALLLDLWPLRRLDWKFWTWLAPGHRTVLAHKVPFALLGVTFAAVAAWAQSSTVATMKTLDEWGLGARAGQAAFGLCFYLRKSIWPFNLSALYELPASIHLAAWPWWACAGSVLAGAALVATIAARGRPGLGVVSLAYAGILAPVLGIAQSGVQLVAERYSYLALIPISAGIAWLLAPRLEKSAPARGLVLAGVLALAGALGALSWRQSAVWKSTLGLWEQALASGQEGPILRNYMGRQLEKLGRRDEAIAAYERSLELDPALGDSWFGLANIFRKQGRFDEAIPRFEKAAQHSPDATRAWMALGLIYVQDLNRPLEGIAPLTRAMQETERLGNPGKTGFSYLLLGAAYGAAEQREPALQWLEKARTFDDTRPFAEQHLRDLGAIP